MTILHAWDSHAKVTSGVFQLPVLHSVHCYVCKFVGCHEKRMRYGPESPAEAPAKRPRIGLSSDEKPTPKLLNRIAGHVIYGHLQSIANELELPEGRASQAMADTAGAKPKTQIFKVIMR